MKKDEETENTAHSGESELSQDQVRAAQALHSSEVRPGDLGSTTVPWEATRRQ